MPKNKFQDVVFTIIMATIMVYGMVVYNVALSMGGLINEAFLKRRILRHIKDNLGHITEEQE